MDDVGADVATAVTLEHFSPSHLYAATFTEKDFGGLLLAHTFLTFVGFGRVSIDVSRPPKG